MDIGPHSSLETRPCWLAFVAVEVGVGDWASEWVTTRSDLSSYNLDVLRILCIIVASHVVTALASGLTMHVTGSLRAWKYYCLSQSGNGLTGP